MNSSIPLYELRAKHHGIDDMELSVWQIPCEATPNIQKPVIQGRLRGRNLALIQHFLSRDMFKEKIRLDVISPKGEKEYPLSEDTAVFLILLFKALSPMKDRDSIHAVAVGVMEMTKTEQAYWLGMCMSRGKPHKVLAALRTLF